jgi:hypothetical protein
MLTFASPSVAPSVAAWIGSLAAPLGTFFTSGFSPSTGKPAASNALAAQASPVTFRSGTPALDAGSRDGDRPCLPHTGDAASGVTYWPCERLNAFILQMAAHGHCVSAAMMLGHRPYAVQQLAAAQQVPDEALRSLVAELQAYFDAPPDSAVQRLADL